MSFSMLANSGCCEVLLPARETLPYDNEKAICEMPTELGWTPPLVSNQFELGIQDGVQFILCKVCNLKSFHLEDIKQKYCGNCRQFHIP